MRSLIKNVCIPLIVLGADEMDPFFGWQLYAKNVYMVSFSAEEVQNCLHMFRRVCDL